MTIETAVAPTSGDPLVALKELLGQVTKRNKNEAETRQKIIDFVLYDFLGWPKNRVAVEEFIKPGFADYVLKKANGDDLLFVEAKKEGVYFELPLPHKANETSSYIGIAKLLSDGNIRAAITQVRNYCFDTGGEYACITNGHEWIFFKTFEKGKKWEATQAFVVRGLKFFETEYTKAVNQLSYVAITERSSLPSLLSSTPPKDRGIFYPKEKISAYSHTINANKLAAKLRPVVTRYFGVIRDDDADFMDRCYVSHREYQNAAIGMRSLIQDSLTPYFEEYGVQQLDDTGKGGRLGGRLTKNIKKKRKGEVLVLFGGKGSGKSTFIKRLLYHKPPPWLRDHAHIAIIDLLNTPEDQAVIRNHIWTTLLRSLDTENLLESERSKLLGALFADRFEIAKRQELFGLSASSDSYNLKLNTLIADWKLDAPYCAQRLADYWMAQERGIVIVLDNTDQYSSPMQDFCFSSAQEISSLLGCVTLISMREERFFNSKIHGLLDAFQNSGFHISSPRPADVFKKRLQYTAGLLSNERKRKALIGAVDKDFLRDCDIYLNILVREFSAEKSPLRNFLTACAHGDIRLSLEVFRSFLLSGYTNVEEMTASGNWIFQIHQVIKPVMIPTRYFYAESQSEIPNIYQIRFNRNGSHFTALRILRKLTKNVDASSPSYMSTSELLAYFADTFNMVDDFEKNLDLLLRRGLVESNNRIDVYSSSVDQIKITNYGAYMVRELAFDFTYCDLVCTDAGIYEEAVNNYLVEAARKEYSYFTKGERVERVRVRLDRVEHFLKYLQKEEMREREFYSLGMPMDEMFTSKALEMFKREKPKIWESAQKQQKRSPSSPRMRRR